MKTSIAIEPSQECLDFADSVVETQHVRFLLDCSPTFSGLEQVDFSEYPRAFVLCDKRLESDWWPKLEDTLKSKLPISGVSFLEAGEPIKHVKSFVKIVDQFAEWKCARNDLLIAIGGGSVLDVAAFAASTYMRGLPLWMIPTTLIGQADASTAGKTCVNTDYAKNLVGTLYFPKLVYNNVTLLHSNSKYDMRQGFSEIFKYGLLGSAQLLEDTLQYHKSPDDLLMQKILRETIRVRLWLRKTDPLVSNLGHTFGHALEKYSGYSVNHGDAISVGTVMALEFAVENKIMTAECKNNIINKMKIIGLNTKVETDIDPKALVRIMLTDKKSTHAKIRLILISDIAHPLETNGSRYYPVESSKVENFLTRFLSNPEFVQKNHWLKLKDNS